jgi:SAM-dependent methyltransferase
LKELSSILAWPSAYLLYQRLVGGVRARQRCIRDQVRPSEAMNVLDIGCGPGYAIQSFVRPNYFGFDISPTYIGYANRRFGSQGKFFCQYFDEQVLTWLPKIDVVLLMGVLHQLDDESAVELLKLAKRAMSPTGRLYTLDGCYRNGQSRIDRFFLDHDRGKNVRSQPAYRKLAGQVFQGVNGTLRRDLFVIPHSTLILECTDCVPVPASAARSEAVPDSGPMVHGDRQHSGRR